MTKNLFWLGSAVLCSIIALSEFVIYIDLIALPRPYAAAASSNVPFTIGTLWLMFALVGWVLGIRERNRVEVSHHSGQIPG